MDPWVAAAGSSAPNLDAIQPFIALLAPGNLIQHWNRFVNLFQDGIFNHLGIDHLLQLKLIQGKNAHHLHQARSQDLALRHS